MVTTVKKRGSTSKYVYVIEGNPIPLARIRISKTSNRVYDSQKELKLITQIGFQNQHDEYEVGLLTGPLHVEAVFYFKIPRSREKITSPGDWMKFRPDGDNLLKFVYDIGNKICWNDDAIIVSGSFKKVYSDNPRTELTVMRLPQYGKWSDFQEE